MTWDHPRSAIISHPVTFYRSHTLHPRFLSGGWPNEIETSECHGNLFAKGRNMISIKHAQNVLNHHLCLVNAKLLILPFLRRFYHLEIAWNWISSSIPSPMGNFHELKSSKWFNMLTAPNANIALKDDGWKTTFLLKWSLFREHVKSRGICKNQSLSMAFSGHMDPSASCSRKKQLQLSGQRRCEYVNFNLWVETLIQPS